MPKWSETEKFEADLVTRLYESDVASALTNQAAREIERLRAVIVAMSEENRNK